MKYLHYLFYALLVGCNLWSPGWAAPQPNHALVPIIHIEAGILSPLGIGLETGRQAKALFPDIERRYDQHLASLFSDSTFDAVVRQRLPGLLKQLDKNYRDELEGIAGAWALTDSSQPGDGQLSQTEFQVLNLLPDLGFAADGSGFGAYAEAAKDEYPIVGRNLDWGSTPALRSLQAITVYQYPDKAVVNIGFAGIASILTGFNNQGLFLAHFNAEPYSPYRQQQVAANNRPVTSSVFRLRAALETQTSVADAADELAKHAYGLSYSVLMADKETVEAFEYSLHGTAQTRTPDSALRTQKWDRENQLAVVDCLMLQTMPDTCKDAKDAIHWQRLQALAKFNVEKPAELTDISGLLLDTANDGYEIFNQNTLQSLVYLPSNNRLYLYAAPEGTPPDTPLHQPYLDLMPTLTDELDGADLEIVLLTWLLLVGMLMLVTWSSRRKTRKQPSAST